MKRKKSVSLSRMLLIPAAVLGTAFVLHSMPDFVRYLKVESM